MSYLITFNADSFHEPIHYSSPTTLPKPLDTTQLDASNEDTSLFVFPPTQPPLLQKMYSQILVVQLICTTPFPKFYYHCHKSRWCSTLSDAEPPLKILSMYKLLLLLHVPLPPKGMNITLVLIFLHDNILPMILHIIYQIRDILLQLKVMVSAI